MSRWRYRWAILVRCVSWHVARAARFGNLGRAGGAVVCWMVSRSVGRVLKASREKLLRGAASWLASSTGGCDAVEGSMGALADGRVCDGY